MLFESRFERPSSQRAARIAVYYGRAIAWAYLLSNGPLLIKSKCTLRMILIIDTMKDRSSALRASESVLPKFGSPQRNRLETRRPNLFFPSLRRVRYLMANTFVGHRDVGRRFKPAMFIGSEPVDKTLSTQGFHEETLIAPASNSVLCLFRTNFQRPRDQKARLLRCAS